MTWQCPRDDPRATFCVFLGREDHKPSVNERLKDVLNKPREQLEIEDDLQKAEERDIGNENTRDRDLDEDHSL
ncbi:hypothetical protein [uncultured Tateyamaria sp.]|uniref:hypothetical protein n=1 Tax=uncultured Tateyamaria sp. TaxID=455651 RepID=UPI002622911A|nr:hypothetical protein [uncultured Tateyamaria sp.]